jgi:hypothetical protein
MNNNNSNSNYSIHVLYIVNCLFFV